MPMVRGGISACDAVRMAINHVKVSVSRFPLVSEQTSVERDGHSPCVDLFFKVEHNTFHTGF